MNPERFKFNKARFTAKDEAVNVANDQMVDVICTHIEPYGKKASYNTAVRDNGNTTLRLLDITCSLTDPCNEIIK